MSAISTIQLYGRKLDKQSARERLAVNYNADARIEEQGNLRKEIEGIPFNLLLNRVTRGENLTFAEARVGMCHVVAATNSHFLEAVKKSLGRNREDFFTTQHALVCGGAFLVAMAAKEQNSGLVPEEVAGITAAGMLDTVLRLDLGQIIETCGMGGDRGFNSGAGRHKTINASTLSALVLASLGLQVLKHGSYANTSAVGSTETVEKFGANIVADSAETFVRIMNKCGFCYLDAHLVKTIHDASHLLMMETINHIVGPMALPVMPRTRINKVMGVNEKIHPEVIAKAYAILHSKGLQQIGGFAIVAGLDSRCVDPEDYEAVQKHTILDEISPLGSIVVFGHGHHVRQAVMIEPEDFGLSFNPNSIMVESTETAIHDANLKAISGEHAVLSRYLAMNAALGLFVAKHSERESSFSNGKPNGFILKDCFGQCLAAIKSGEAKIFNPTKSPV